MLYIRHRINTTRDLKTISQHMGIEVDIRYEKNKLILQHDPFCEGEYFEDFLKKYKHAFIVLNIKSEGIEKETLHLLKRNSIKDYFFLDLSFPSLVKLSSGGEKNIAVRFSEYEPIEQSICLKNMVKWAWIDCFNKLPIDDKNYEMLKRHFKLCIVSPELQNHSTDKISEFKKVLSKYDIDAICTKVPEIWEK